MNKRIKELAKEHLVRDEHTEFGWQECHKYVFDPEELSEFAELIIRECADIAQHHVMNISTYADAEFVEEQIQKHFGVEE